MNSTSSGKRASGGFKVGFLLFLYCATLSLSLSLSFRDSGTVLHATCITVYLCVLFHIDNVEVRADGQKHDSKLLILSIV